jgi:hypothetical protein
MCIASSPVYTVNMVKIKEILKKTTCIFCKIVIIFVDQMNETTFTEVDDFQLG